MPISKPPTFTARYRSYCVTCDGWIEEGDEVRWQGDDVVHVDCLKSRPVPFVAPCPACFTVPAVNGSCGCD